MPAKAAALARFSPATQRWFQSTFAAPTPVQSAAWDAIASGKHALVIAPTGSGKTLAAFLHAIDALFREREQQEPPDKATRTRILYISPVKALAADVQRNLQLPLEGGLPAAPPATRKTNRANGRHAFRRYPQQRAGEAAAHAARYPDHDAGIAVSDADLSRPRGAARRHHPDPG